MKEMKLILPDETVENFVNENGEHYIEVRVFRYRLWSSDLIFSYQAVKQAQSHRAGIQRVYAD